MNGLATYGVAAFASFLWGINFPIAHLVVSEMHPMAAAAGRFGIAAVAILAIAALRRERVAILRYALPLGFLALVGVVGFNVLFFLAMGKTSAVNGALIMATNPLLTAILAAIILGERPDRRYLLAVPVAFAGVAIVVLGGGASLQLAPGDGLMLGADLSWASYNVLSRRLMPAETALSNTAVVTFYGAVGLIAAALFMDAPVPVASEKGIIGLLTLGLAGTVMAYLCYNHSLAKLGAARTALFLNLVPVCAMLGSAVLGNPPTALQLAGGALVVAAVSFTTLPKLRATRA